MPTIQDKRTSENRDPSRDGMMNQLEGYALSHFEPFWAFVSSVAPLKKLANRVIINRAANRASRRPHRLSSMAIKGDMKREIAGYSSWESLTDKNWFARHLSPRDLPRHPELARLRPLFEVGANGPGFSEDSTLLFLSFAQCFTDGFLMTRSDDSRQTNTSHHIDFNPLYGLTRDETNAVRLLSDEAGENGLLKFQTDDNGEIFAPKYFDI